MNELIINLLRYFSKFVGKAVLGKMFIQPATSRLTGYDSIKTEILAMGNDDVIPEIQKFILSMNENYVSEKIKNSNEFILFVEYGKMTVDPDSQNEVMQSLAVSVVHNLSKTNNDNLNEIILMNKCLEILDIIIRKMHEEQNELNYCANNELISFPAELQIVDPREFYGCGGWCAMFSNSNTTEK
ncbi:MAG: hypothetical protein VB046_08305 [Paludibacter sp.]|nr:hypothetical protein [Paludibacter sp.]